MAEYRYEHLMSPIKIGSIMVKNRYAVGPMGGRFFIYGDKGEYNENGIEYWTERARGGFGLIVTGSNVSNQTVEPFNPIQDNPNPLYAPGVFKHTARDMLDRVHANGAKMFMQITVGPGRMREAKSCSAIPKFKHPEQLTEVLTRDEIELKIVDMIKLARHAKDCGFDGVEIHGMHWGYLLDQFAMAYTNHRTDEYGGDLEGRLTFIRKIIFGIKEACGKDFPLSVRMSMKTYMGDYNKTDMDGTHEVGRDLDESIEIAKLFESYGVDMLNVNSGTYDTFYYCIGPYYMPKGYNIELARKLKTAVNIPIFLAGLMDDPDMCERAVAEGAIDGVTLARASLVDSQYPQKVFEGVPEKIRPCIQCANCIETNLAEGVPLCSVNPAAMQEHNYGVTKTLKPKKIIVVGGGVAGMEAARTASIRGHQVELYEATGILGGHLEEAGSHPFKTCIAKLNKWYQRELSDMGIPVHLNTALTQENIKALAPDVVVLTVGSDHFVPKIPGYDHSKAVICYDVLMKNVSLGEKVVVVGGGLTGSELAYDLASYEKKNVTLVEALDDILSSGPKVPMAVNMMLRDLLDINKVDIKMHNKIVAVNDEGAVVEDTKTGEQTLISADNVVFAIGLKPKPSMLSALAGCGMEVYQVGDGRSVGNIRSAVSEAYEIAKNI